MEETYQVLLDEGALIRNSVTRLIKPIGELKIPPTVQGILAARIEPLPADAKDLLQTLSVIGRQFPISLVRAVVPKSHDALERMLNSVQLGEFIYEQPAVGDTEYRKSALFVCLPWGQHFCGRCRYPLYHISPSRLFAEVMTELKIRVD